MRRGGGTSCIICHRMAQAGGNKEAVPRVRVRRTPPSLELSPEPEGRFRWLGDRTLVFEPAYRLPRATRYTLRVRRGTIPLAPGAAPLAEDFVREFETTRGLFLRWSTSRLLKACLQDSLRRSTCGVFITAKCQGAGPVPCPSLNPCP